MYEIIWSLKKFHWCLHEIKNLIVYDHRTGSKCSSQLHGDCFIILFKLEVSPVLLYILIPLLVPSCGFFAPPLRCIWFCISQIPWPCSLFFSLFYRAIWIQAFYYYLHHRHIQSSALHSSVIWVQTTTNSFDSVSFSFFLWHLFCVSFFHASLCPLWTLLAWSLNI